jgi:hypothetical protein
MTRPAAKAHEKDARLGGIERESIGGEPLSPSEAAGLLPAISRSTLAAARPIRTSSHYLARLRSRRFSATRRTDRVILEICFPPEGDVYGSRRRRQRVNSALTIFGRWCSEDTSESNS